MPSVSCHSHSPRETLKTMRSEQTMDIFSLIIFKIFSSFLFFWSNVLICESWLSPMILCWLNWNHPWTQQWPQDWKYQFLLQSQRRVMPKNVQITKNLCSFHMPITLCSKSIKLVTSSMWTKNFQITNWVWSGRGTRNQIANIFWIIKEVREVQKNIYFCFTD